MAIQRHATAPHGGRGHVHRRHARPGVPMAGPVADGGHIVWNSTPGCGAR